MATGYKLHVYNLPEKVKGGIKIHGLKNKKGKDIVVLFHRLDHMDSVCTIEGTRKKFSLKADTPLIDIGNDEYKIDEEAQNDGEEN